MTRSILQRQKSTVSVKSRGNCLQRQVYEKHDSEFLKLSTMGNIRTPHWTRAPKFERKSFDVACMQCGYSHSHQQVPFTCVARARPVWMRPQTLPLRSFLSKNTTAAEQGDGTKILFKLSAYRFLSCMVREHETSPMKKRSATILTSTPGQMAVGGSTSSRN